MTGSSTTFEVKVRNFLQEGKYVRSWPILLLGQGMIVLHEQNANASKKSVKPISVITFTFPDLDINHDKQFAKINVR